MALTLCASQKIAQSEARHLKNTSEAVRDLEMIHILFIAGVGIRDYGHPKGPQDSQGPKGLQRLKNLKRSGGLMHYAGMLWRGAQRPCILAQRGAAVQQGTPDPVQRGAAWCSIARHALAGRDAARRGIICRGLSKCGA